MTEFVILTVRWFLSEILEKYICRCRKSYWWWKSLQRFRFFTIEICYIGICDILLNGKRNIAKMPAEFSSIHWHQSFCSLAKFEECFLMPIHFWLTDQIKFSLDCNSSPTRVRHLHITRSPSVVCTPVEWPTRHFMNTWHMCSRAKWLGCWMLRSKIWVATSLWKMDWSTS